MRKLFVLLIAVCGLLAFTSTDGKKSAATVNQYEGIYVFSDSKPEAETEYLGTVKYSMSLGSGQYSEVRDKLVKKAKKEYPGAEAIIINFNDGGTDKADVVKFK